MRAPVFLNKKHAIQFWQINTLGYGLWIAAKC